jgi:hypothetical protein
MDMNLAKRFLAVILILSLIMVMTACGGHEDAVSGYKVTVRDPDGNPVVGALVVLCQDQDGGTCYLPVTTDEQGVARFSPEAVPVQKSMKVRVLSANGFELPLDENGDIRYTPIPEGNTEITLILNRIAP